MRRLLLIVVIGLGIAATSWFAAMAVAEWQLRSQLRAAQREITARRIDEARTRLTRLAERLSLTNRPVLLSAHLRLAFRP